MSCDRARSGLVRVNAAGTYLFVDIRIEEGASPGSCPISVETSQGRSSAPFELLAPLPRAGRFQGLSRDDVIYLLMPDRFANGDPSNDDPPKSRGLHDRSMSRYYHGGDLQGVIDRLPYLKDLGITAIWTNPVYDNSDRLNRKEVYDQGPIADYHGYGAVDFYAVDEHLGSLELFRRLVDLAHASGIKIIQDQVANHTGPYHPWVEDTPTPDWFNGSADRHLANEWQIWTLHDPYSPPQVRKPTLDGWFLDILPDLNQDNPEVSRYIIQNTLWWVSISGVDAIRQDTLPYVPRRFWRDWTQAIGMQFPRLEVVGEFFDGNPALVAHFQGGKARSDGIDSGIHTLFDFPLYYAVRDAFTGRESMRRIPMTLAHDYLYTDPDKLVTFIDLHDTKRFMGEEGADLPGLQLAYTLILTCRGIPLIYYGSEIAMEGGDDPDNRRDFPGGWPEDERNAFEATGRNARERAVHSRVRRLTELRRAHPALRRGRTINLNIGQDTYAFARLTPSDAAVVVFNNSESPSEFEFDAVPAGMNDGSRLRDGLGRAPDVTVREGRIRVKLAARSAAVYLKRKSGPESRP